MNEEKRPVTETRDDDMYRDRFNRELVQILPELVTLSRFLVPDNRAADRLVQDAVADAYRDYSGEETGKEFRRLLLSALVEETGNGYRPVIRSSTARSPEESEDGFAMELLEDIEEASDVTEPLHQELDINDVREKVLELPFRYRLPVVLLSVARLSYREIAETTGIPLDRVRDLLHNGRRELHAALAQEAVDKAPTTAGS